MQTRIAEANITVRSRSFGEVELPLFVEVTYHEGGETRRWLNLQVTEEVMNHVKTANIEGKKYLVLSPFAASQSFEQLRDAYEEDEYGVVGDTINYQGKSLSEVYVEIVDVEKFNELAAMITDDSIRKMVFDKKAKLNGGTPVRESQKQASAPKNYSYKSEEEAEWDDDQNFWTPENLLQKKEEAPQFDIFDRERLAK